MFCRLVVCVSIWFRYLAICLGILCCASYIWSLVFGIRYLVSGVWVWDIWVLVVGIWYFVFALVSSVRIWNFVFCFGILHSVFGIWFLEFGSLSPYFVLIGDILGRVFGICILICFEIAIWNFVLVVLHLLFGIWCLVFEM